MSRKQRKKSGRKTPTEKGTNTNGFFAYPSRPRDRSEIIESAVNIINKRSVPITLTSWRSMPQGTARIILNILDSINDADFVISDISGLNPNVLFEAGYAFGTSKKGLLVTQGNSQMERERDINDLFILRAFTIDPYHNAQNLASRIIARNPHKPHVQPEINTYTGRESLVAKPSRALLLRGMCKHEMAIQTHSTMKSMFNDLIVDDWDENSSQILTWYVRSVLTSQAVCAIFVPESWDYSREMNSRFAFVCGMAVGLRKPILMVGMPGFETPFDYQDYMFIPQNSERIDSFIKKTFSEVSIAVSSVIEEDTSTTNHNPPQELSPENKKMILLEINIGDTIAENEELSLSKYFVRTGQFRKALQSRQAVVVGYKGTGKTAAFFQIGAALREDSRNLVCELKPADYNMHRFLQALRAVWDQEGHVGYTLDTVWKLMCYCELLRILQATTSQQPSYIQRTEDERNLMALVEDHEELVMAPFEKRLEIMSEWLAETGYNGDNFTKRSHDSFLIDAKNVLAPFLAKSDRVVFLIDNLDKAWTADSDLTLQAQMVHSLLSIHKRLQSDLGTECVVSVIAFLRRNIYDYIVNDPSLVEPDKLLIDTIELKWNDTEMLMRIIEKRFRSALDSTDFDPWSEFFCQNVDETPVKEWISSHVLPRPRDLINFILKSMEWAFNRDHSEILAADLKSALDDYSGFALSQIIAEYRAEHPWLSNLVYSFTGEQSWWDVASITQHIKERYADPGTALLTLVEVGILGVSINGGAAQFTETVNQARALMSKVKNRVAADDIQFVLHSVFHSHLKVK